VNNASPAFVEKVILENQIAMMETLEYIRENLDPYKGE
jgi:hypothetical protein